MQQLAPGPDQTLASSTVVSTFSNLEFPQCEHFPSFEICKGFQDSPAFSEDRRVIRGQNPHKLWKTKTRNPTIVVDL